jgi:uncharacterized protein (DUF1015 family)
MSFIRPFRAWRYNPEKVHSVEEQLSPLFDVVSDEQRKELYSRPFNSIHLSVPENPSLVPAKLEEWKSSGILKQDPLPGIYIYYQEFSLFGDPKKYTRKGFICMVRLDENEIVEHEAVMTSSVSDRAEILESTFLNAAPTHGLYEDGNFELEPLMDEYMEHPLLEYVDYQGVINKMAILQHKEEIERFTTLLRKKKIYLADGHHRLQASYEIKKRFHKENNPVPDPMSGYHLMYVTNLSSDDLRILPIHRVYHFDEDVRDAARVLKEVNQYFEITEVSHSRVPLYEEMKGMEKTFGMVLGARQFLIRLRKEVDPVRDNQLDLPEVVKTLDYTILHYFCFEKAFGVPYQNQLGTHKVHYLKDYGSAIKMAQSDLKKGAFIMKDLSMKQVMEVCNVGTIMPPKSTYFYPKVVCGLVFASIAENENNSEFDSCFRFTEA